MFGRRVILALLLVLTAVRAARADAPVYTNQDFQNQFRIRNLLTPVTGGEPVRRGDMPGSGLPCVVVFTGGSPLFRCGVAQAAGATTGGSDFQGPGAYLNALTGGGTAAGPGSAALTLHLDAGIYVTGLLPLGNLTPGTLGQVLVTGAGPAASWGQVGSAGIASGAVGNAQAATMPALTAKANATNATAAPQDVPATADGQVFQRAAGALTWALVPPASIAQGGATSGQILGWNGSAWAPANPASSAPGGTGFGVASAGAWAATRTLTSPLGTISIGNGNGSGGNPTFDLPVLGPETNYGGSGIAAIQRDVYGRITGATAQTFVTPTTNIGFDGDVQGVGPAVGPITLTLSQYGATSGQVLTWNGSAWRPSNSATTGANANGYYLVRRATSAPVNAFNLGSLTTGPLWCAVSAGDCLPSIATGAQLLSTIAPPTGVLKWTGSALAAATIQASGATTGGADIQGPGAYVTGGTGDVAFTGPGTVPATIQPNVVSNAKLRQSAGLSLVGNPGVGTANVQDVTCTGTGQIFQTTGAGVVCQSLAYSTLTGTVPATGLGSFSNGSVIFWNGGLAEDHSNFFYDPAAHRFGLGTVSPSAPLHIVGNSTGGVGAYVQNNNAGNSAYSELRLINNVGTIADIFLGSSTYAGSDGGPNRLTIETSSGTGNYIHFAPSGVLALTLTSAAVFLPQYAAGGMAKILPSTGGQLALATHPLDYLATGDSISNLSTGWPAAPDVLVAAATGPVGDSTFTESTVTHLVTAHHLTLTGDDGSSVALALTESATQQLAKFNGRLDVGTAGAFQVTLMTGNISRVVVGAGGLLQLTAYSAGMLKTDASGNVGIASPGFDYQAPITYPTGVLYGAAGALTSGAVPGSGRVAYSNGTILTGDAGFVWDSANQRATLNNSDASGVSILLNKAGTQQIAKSGGRVDFGTTGPDMATLMSSNISRVIALSTGEVQIPNLAGGSDALVYANAASGQLTRVALSGLTLSGGTLSAATTTYPASPQIAIGTGTGLTGASTFTLTTGAVTIGSSNGSGYALVLNQAADQQINKTGGNLYAGTSSANAFNSYTGGTTRQSITASGVIEGVNLVGATWTNSGTPLAPTSPTTVEWSMTPQSTASAASLQGLYRFDGVTETLTGTTHVTSHQGGLYLGANTLTSSSAVTVDELATLTVAGPWTCTGSASCTTRPAIWVQGGPVEIDGSDASTVALALNQSATQEISKLNGRFDIGTGVGNSSLFTLMSGGNSHLLLDSSGTLSTNNANGLQEIPTSSTGVTTQFWKDASPTKAVAVGNSVPGTAITSDLVLSVFNGTSWAEGMRLTNAGDTVVKNNLEVDSVAGTSMVKTSTGHVLQAAVAGVDYQAPITSPASQTMTWSQALSASGVGLTANMAVIFFPNGSLGSQTSNTDVYTTVSGSVGLTLNAHRGVDATFPIGYTTTRTFTGGVFTCSNYYSGATSGSGTDTEVFGLYYSTDLSAYNLAASLTTSNWGTTLGPLGRATFSGSIPSGAMLFVAVYRTDSATGKSVTEMNIDCQAVLY